MSTSTTQNTRTNMLPIGEYKGIIKSCNVSISTERPAIFTRCALEFLGEPKADGASKEFRDITHVVRATNADSLRIGCDELRSAFPEAFADCNGPEDIITAIMTKSNLLEGKDVTVGIEYQVNGQGIVQKDAQQNPYFNVRLRPNTRNLSEALARKLAKNIVGGVMARAAATAAADDI